ncbi:hypothetical protein [Virgibacillus doumboii]|uniref:hypothetical protein n=1 Tax=Virgibacillus doumboii TaxID=2697503 RepID=UPI0013DFB77D|nr:hypothetical protein [Virgibacillus doumboii]
MIIELLYELLGEMSPMYFYLGFALSVMYSIRVLNVDMNNTFMSSHDYAKECHALSFRQLPDQEPLGEIDDIHNWITHTTKRIDAPDDDTDNHSFSFTNNTILRGGPQWTKNLYSLSFRNIA